MLVIDSDLLPEGFKTIHRIGVKENYETRRGVGVCFHERRSKATAPSFRANKPPN